MFAVPGFGLFPFIHIFNNGRLIPKYAANSSIVFLLPVWACQSKYFWVIHSLNVAMFSIYQNVTVLCKVLDKLVPLCIM